MTLGVDELSDNVYATLLGHTVDGITGELTADIDDVAPFVGIGFYGVKKLIMLQSTEQYGCLKYNLQNQQILTQLKERQQRLIHQ